ncbi:MAG TPA: response regulator [Tepidisphaeraceae bacterium]|jgi:CheY-like chemotaxis protein|nr:response regulator [Tepidisphaeraceae bacterium]
MVISRNQPLLLVEDSPEDRETTTRALRKAGLTLTILSCVSGDDALDLLHQRGKYADTAPVRPAAILLDLNMPGTDGREVLAEIKANEKLRSIPVVVITTSRDERDIHTCYESGCNAYIRKPVDLSAFMRSMQRLTDFWFAEAILP